MANRMILNETSYHGSGAVQNVVVEAQRRGFKKALVVTDKDLVKFKVAEKVTALLEQANLDYVLFDEVKANPSVDIIKNGVETFKQIGADYLIAIGGGSPIDSAKAIGIIINNPEFSDVLSLEGVAPTKNKCVPIIAVTTTAGTAAEVTINYVITDEAKKRKFVCVDVNDIPVVAIVDPDMMSSMPKGLTAATGMDALTHAIEGYITKGAWELTDALHLKAIEIISRSLRGAVENTPEGRAGMALGQYVAGMGFSNVGLGVVHSMAHPLSAYYDTPHGIANAVLLPYVMDFNKDFTGEKYREIARAMGVSGVDQMSPEEYRNAAVNAVKQLAKDVGIPEKLSAIGVQEADLPALSVDAFNDVCTGGNPRDCTAEEILDVYKIAF
ncbi:MAG: lactaldehyde reductase [[Actinobacillus] rossii]|uniref:L-1,2-propanediol oxidoreductase n=1 Tax=[Actinobacillus] rossii TaxID=123820 RepID=A0A380TNL8_9PAST|nr:lactaldehyde reductase [[Actinobacillus] rossii]MDY4505680.1 lactaldehyde reductase [[Actinobacillus] rossii]SUT87827.1 L-1,2-propanediol oxidoreductase [[Actinobacillus] rossii]